MIHDTEFLFILVLGLLQIWNAVRPQSMEMDESPIVVMWNVDPKNSRMSIVVPSEREEQFIPENALVIWKGYLDNEANPNRYLYYWLGKLVSPDTAIQTAGLAMKAALEKCHNRPIIHREVGGHESEAFRSCFENILGEVRNTDRSIKRLFRVRRNIETRIKQVLVIYLAAYVCDDEIPVTANFLNESGCLVLHSKAIFVHCQDAVRVYELLIAFKLAEQLSVDAEELSNDDKDEIEILFFEPSQIQELSETNQQHFHVFLSELGIDRYTYDILLSLPATPREKDLDDERKIILLQPLLDLDDVSGLISVLEETVEPDYPINMKSLHTKHCMVLDSASLSGIFIWIGKQSEASVRIEAARVAERMLLIDKKYPLETPVTVVEEGTEPLIFKINFIDGLER